MRKPFPIPSAMQLVLVLAMASATAGCGMLYRQPIYQGNLLEPANVEQLQEGMDKRQVMALLGTPSIADPFHHDRWDYTTSQRTGRMGKVEVRNFTVWFENDAVARWDGNYFPEQDQKLSETMRKWGNLPRDKDKKKGRR